MKFFISEHEKMTKRSNRLAIRGNSARKDFLMNIVSQKQRWLTVNEYAEKYGVVPLTVYRMVNRGDLTVKRLGKNGWTIRILDSEVTI